MSERKRYFFVVLDPNTKPGSAIRKDVKDCGDCRFIIRDENGQHREVILFVNHAGTFRLTIEDEKRTQLYHESGNAFAFSEEEK